MALSLMLIVAGLVVRSHTSGARAIQTESGLADVGARAGRALERIVRELTFASGASLGGVPLAPLFDTAASFDLVESIDVATTGNLTWRPARIQFEYAPGELDDGVDNDGNGLIDDGRAVLYYSWGRGDQRRRVLCNGVAEYLDGETPDGTDENGNGLIDERGLSFQREGERIHVYLSVERRDSNGFLAQETLSTSVHHRN